MIVLAVDPGPTVCGMVLYDAVARRVVDARGAAPVFDALAYIADVRPPTVLIERVESYGIAGASLLDTARVCGRLEQRALDCGATVRLLYRRDVCSALGVHGGNRDAQVRERCIEAHGGSVEVAVGRKKQPGPLYGVSSHAWQALGLVLANALREGA
jgi:hypothetical protein